MAWTLLITLVISAPAILIFGVIDGLARISRRRLHRILAALLILVMLSYWVYGAKSFALATKDLFGMDTEGPPLASYLGSLAGAELAVALTWVVAKATCMLARLFASRP